MKDNTIFWIIGIVVVVGILNFSNINFLNFFSVTNPELGWIYYEGSETSFTNLERTDFGGSCSGGLPRYTLDSLYWEFPSYCDHHIIGGDIKMMVGYCASARFKPNLANLHFKTTFRGDGWAGPQVGIKGLFGYSGGRYETGTLELVPSVLEKGRSSVFVNGIYKQDIVSDEMYLIASSNCGIQAVSFTEILYPHYKPLFECALENDEILIFDEFSTNFNINDLAYPVKKFCINNPPQVRSFTERGIATDYNGQILIDLSAGKTINVPFDQTIRIIYITEIQSGIYRCQADEAWNVILGRCENILRDPLIQECVVDSDCSSPCVGITSQCIDNKCVYSGRCIIQPSQQTFWDLLRNVWNKFLTWLNNIF